MQEAIYSTFSCLLVLLNLRKVYLFLQGILGIYGFFFHKHARVKHNPYNNIKHIPGRLAYTRSFHWINDRLEWGELLFNFNLQKYNYYHSKYVSVNLFLNVCVN